MTVTISPVTVGYISAAVVAVSGMIYATRTWQSAIRPNITSWALWSVLGFALLVTYRDSGAGESVWPAVIGFFNPCVITAIAIYRRGERKPMTVWERRSILLCFVALALWLLVRGEKELVLYALILSILADACAIVPTYIGIIEDPESDRPGVWAIYGIGYGISAFAIEEHTLANYLLPGYMFFGALGVAAILAWPRLKQRVPISRWI